MEDRRKIVDGVVYGFDAQVAVWVNERLGGGEVLVPFVALGALPEGHDAEAIIAKRKPLELVAGAYFFNHDEGHRDIYMACACDNITALRPRTLSKLLAYPFGVLGCRRISVEIAENNERAIRQAEAFGFQVEGIKRASGVVMMGLLPEECPFWQRQAESDEAHIKRLLAA